MRVIKNDELSVLIEAGNLKVWVDVSIDTDYNDVVVEWNKYIFHLDNPEDLAIRAFQDDLQNFEEVSDLAIAYLEKVSLIAQDENGEWFEL